MAKYIRSLDRKINKGLSKQLTRDRALGILNSMIEGARQMNASMGADICRCKEAEEGEHECAAVEYMEAQAAVTEQAKQPVYTYYYYTDKNNLVLNKSYGYRCKVA